MGDTSGIMRAPWSEKSVAALNRYQRRGRFHPYTCPNRGDGRHQPRDGEDLGQLVATPDGWRCHGCEYTQDWAHSFSTLPEPTTPATGGE